MSSLDQIGIQIVPHESPGASNGLAILHEIADSLSALINSGKTSSIDLHGIPMTDRDHELLREALGDGEIQATLHLGGVSEVRETGCHGVWWIVHRNADGQTLAEIIEVTLFPSILATPAEDAPYGLERLKLAISDIKGNQVEDEKHAQ